RAGIRPGVANRWPTLATRGLAGHHPAEPEDHAQPHHRTVRQACRRASSALYGARLAILNKPSSQPAPAYLKETKKCRCVSYLRHSSGCRASVELPTPIPFTTVRRTECHSARRPAQSRDFTTVQEVSHG